MILKSTFTKMDCFSATTSVDPHFVWQKQKGPIALTFRSYAEYAISIWPILSKNYETCLC